VTATVEKAAMAAPRVVPKAAAEEEAMARAAAQTATSVTARHKE
jgi:hypothetical protein